MDKNIRSESGVMDRRELVLRGFGIMLMLGLLFSVYSDVYPRDYLGTGLRPPAPENLSNGDCRSLPDETVCFTTWDIDALGVETGMPLMASRWRSGSCRASGSSLREASLNCTSPDPSSYMSGWELSEYIFWREHELPFLPRESWDNSTRYVRKRGDNSGFFSNFSITVS